MPRCNVRSASSSRSRREPGLVAYLPGLPDVPSLVGEHHREHGAQAPAEDANRRRPVPGTAQVETVGVNQPFAQLLLPVHELPRTPSRRAWSPPA